jgi:hypothetical protein
MSPYKRDVAPRSCTNLIKQMDLGRPPVVVRGWWGLGLVLGLGLGLGLHNT